MATATPRTESPNEKSSRILGARLAVRKPGSTPATIRAVPVRTALRTRGGVQMVERVGTDVRETERRARFGQRMPETAGLRRGGHQQPLPLILVQDEGWNAADRFDPESAHPGAGRPRPRQDVSGERAGQADGGPLGGDFLDACSLVRTIVQLGAHPVRAQWRGQNEE